MPNALFRQGSSSLTVAIAINLRPFVRCASGGSILIGYVASSLTLFVLCYKSYLLQIKDYYKATYPC